MKLQPTFLSSPLGVVLAMLGIFMAFALGTPNATAHMVEGANLQLVGDLSEEELIFEVTAETSLISAIADVRYELRDQFPTIEDKKEAIEAFFRENCPVIVDGIEIAPILTALEFQANEKLINLGEVSDFVTAYLMLRYPIGKTPRTVDITWGIFLPDKALELPPDPDAPVMEPNHDPRSVDSVFYTFGRIDMISLSPSEPQFIWHASDPVLSVEAEQRLQQASNAGPFEEIIYLKWPLMALLTVVLLGAFFAQGRRLPLWQGGLALVFAGLVVVFSNDLYWIRLHEGAPPLGKTAAKQRFKDLHQNIYRAFDYQQDEQIYDTLAQSVSGALLDEVYREVYHSLVMQEEGGAVCRVKKVDYLNCEVQGRLSDEEAYKIQCRWRVYGLVQHWGHTHERVNEYEAMYQLQPEDNAWKITAVDVSEEKQVSVNSTE